MDWLFWKKKPPVSGISIFLLQKRLERYSTERLNEAMQRVWRKEYDPEKFFALSIFDGEGATVKALGAFFGIRHFDRWLNSKELGDLELPAWAVHAGYSSLEYACPGGIPQGELRHKVYALMGLLCAELLSSETVGILFPEERVLVPNTSEFQKRVRSGLPLDPTLITTTT